MQQRLASETKLVKGLVMDHGARHPDMPRALRNAYILTCNVSLEWEKTELDSVTQYSDPATRDALVEKERSAVDKKCRAIIDLKRKVCEKNDKTFMIVNQKGIEYVLAPRSPPMIIILHYFFLRISAVSSLLC